MTFAEALVRIEELSLVIESLEGKDMDWHHEYFEAKAKRAELLQDHTDSIVQLGKVAAEMREELAYDTEDLGKTLTNGMLAYDKLVKEDV